MAPSRKKKKGASNPSRGFATTSLPSKPKAADDDRVIGADDAISDPISEIAPSRADDGDSFPFRPTTTTKPQSESDEVSKLSPEQFEEHLQNEERQSIVKEYGSWCKGEAQRQVTRLKTQRRQLRAQAQRLSTPIWLPTKITNGILGLANTSGNCVKTNSKLLQIENSFRDETKLLSGLWTLHLILILLCLPRTNEALEHVAILSTQQAFPKTQDSIWGLQECFEWYARNSSASELPDYEDGIIPAHRQTATLGVEAVFSERPNVNASNSSKNEQLSDDQAPEDLIYLSESDSDGNDPEALEAKYIKLKTLEFQTVPQKKTASPAEVVKQPKSLARIHRKMLLIENDILFDKVAAEQAWTLVLNDLRRENAVRDKFSSDGLLVGGTRPEKDSKTSEAGEGPIRHASEHQPVDETNSSDVGNEDLFGDMFTSEQPGEHSSSEDRGQAEVIRHLQFGSWSGLSPRHLFEDLSKLHDDGRQIKYHILQKTSYSVRHRVQVNWSMQLQPDANAIACMPAGVDLVMKPTRWSLEMHRVTAPDIKHSEAYCCALLLFLLLCIDSKEQKLDTRLGTVWRNLLKELADARNLLINEQDLLTLKNIKAIIDRTRLDDSKAKDSSQMIKHNHLESTALLAGHKFKHTSSCLGAERVLQEWNTRISRSAFQQMLLVRRQLPIHNYKTDILDAVNNNPVTIICAETGAGKSTGIPVLILEQNYTEGRDVRILVTQPRRISAITLARRVSQELGEDKNDLGSSRSLVGYAIRLESRTSSTTRITYATTGVLLRMLENSMELNDLDYIVLDEVHERTMDLDLLSIALRYAQRRRQRSLKLILMSATVDAQKFSDYFGGAPVLNLPGRTFSVEVGFLEDAIEATNDIASMEGQSSDQVYEEENTSENDDSEAVLPATDLDPTHYSTKTQSILKNLDEYRIDYGLIIKLAIAIATKQIYSQHSAAILIFMPGIGEIRRLHNLFLSSKTFNHGWNFHLLHSSFSTEELEKAFLPPPAGYRKIVIATNIAETGITIPDVTAVIDTCKEKIMRYDERRQLSKLTEGFVSRSSARQRRGRAARVQEGLCFHLVTRHRHDKLLLEQQVPELLRLSLQSPILRIKVWNMGSIEDTLHSSIDPPSRKAVVRAIERLKDAGALTKSEELTPLGQQIARLPLELMLAKLALLGGFFKCLDPALTLISLLTSKSIFFTSTATSQQNSSKTSFSKGHSDLISSLYAYQSWEKAKTAGSGHTFCRKNRLSEQNLLQVREQKIQLFSYLVDAGLVVLETAERSLLNESRSNSNSNDFYHLPDRYSNRNVNDDLLSSILAMAFYPKVIMREDRSWRNVYTNQHVSLANGSINSHNINTKPPKWLSFYEAMQSKSGNLNVFETSAIPEFTLAILLGDADFKWFSGVIVIDNGRIRLSVKEWEQMAALKILRERMRGLLDRWYKDPRQTISESQEKWITLWNEIVTGSEIEAIPSRSTQKSM